MATHKHAQRMIDAYIAEALKAPPVYGVRPAPDALELFTDARKEAAQVCGDFYRRCSLLLSAWDFEQAGADLWNSRNGDTFAWDWFGIVAKGKNAARRAAIEAVGTKQDRARAYWENEKRCAAELGTVALVEDLAEWARKELEGVTL